MLNFSFAGTYDNHSLASPQNQGSFRHGLIQVLSQVCRNCGAPVDFNPSRLVEPLGLLVGLSVVVVAIVIFGAVWARRLYKEAY